MAEGFEIYFTSDTHGHVFPVDYAMNRPEHSGILNMAGDIKKGPDTLIIDGGDSLQGTPLIQYYLSQTEEKGPHPVAEAFNALGLDYFTLGNHDFNFGYEVIRDYIRAMKARCICANVEDLRGELAISPYTVHILSNGLRIGITGIVTDHVNIWEQPQNLKHLRVLDAYEQAAEMSRRLRPMSDVSVLIYHGGLEKDPVTGKRLSDSRENIACELAGKLDYDIILTGHQHMSISGTFVGKTLLVQPPANAGMYVHISGRMDEDRRTLSLDPELCRVGGQHKEEPYASLLPLEDKVQHWLDLPVGSLERAIEPEGKLDAAIHGSCVADLFNMVQLEETGADISCTSLGNEPIGLESTVSMRDISAAYPFANTLVVLEVDRDVVRQLLERCASYLGLREGRPEISEEFLKPKVEHYNYDFFSGIRYEFDLRRPVGDRVTLLTRADGSPLEGKLRLCTSNYRASGTGGYEVLSSCPVLYRGSREMPDIITEYIREKSPVKLPESHPFKVIF